MKKDNYKAEFEEHRKEISLDEGHDETLPSRAELHRKGRKPQKRSSHLLINVILGLFTLIPVLILVYFLSDFYLPEDSTKAKVESSGSIYEVNNTADNKKTEDASDSEKETKSQTEPKTDKKVEEKGDKKPVVNVNPTPEKKPEQKPEKKPEQKPEKKPEQKPEKKPEQKPTGKTHTVAGGENLYRIALKHYGDGSDAAVAKIRQANGLSSNEIRVGQNLIIP